MASLRQASGRWGWGPAWIRPPGFSSGRVSEQIDAWQNRPHLWPRATLLSSFPSLLLSFGWMDADSTSKFEALFVWGKKLEWRQMHWANCGSNKVTSKLAALNNQSPCLCHMHSRQYATCCSNRCHFSSEVNFMICVQCLFLLLLSANLSLFCHKTVLATPACDHCSLWYANCVASFLSRWFAVKFSVCCSRAKEGRIETTWITIWRRHFPLSIKQWHAYRNWNIVTHPLQQVMYYMLVTALDMACRWTFNLLPCVASNLSRLDEFEQETHEYRARNLAWRQEPHLFALTTTEFGAAMVPIQSPADCRLHCNKY